MAPVAVPALTGQTVGQAKQTLQGVGLSFGAVLSGPSEDDAVVFDSNPGVGSQVPGGTVINVRTFPKGGGNNGGNGGNGGNNGGNGGFIGGLGR